MPSTYSTTSHDACFAPLGFAHVPDKWAHPYSIHCVLLLRGTPDRNSNTPAGSRTYRRRFKGRRTAGDLSVLEGGVLIVTRSELAVHFSALSTSRSPAPVPSTPRSLACLVCSPPFAAPHLLLIFADAQAILPELGMTAGVGSLNNYDRYMDL